MSETRRRTRAEAEMQAQLDTLEPGTKRYEVLSAAHRFKIAWIDLGDKLTTVRESNTWQSWGYASFEAYCRRELHVRTDTANKLTRSFAFLRDHAADNLAARDTQELPTLDVVDLLSQAHQRTKVTPQQLETITEEVFERDGKSPTRNQVVKRFREIDPQAFRATPKPVLAEGDLRKALLIAERLHVLLKAQPGVSKQAVVAVEQAVSELRGLSLEQQQTEAERQSA